MSRLVDADMRAYHLLYSCDCLLRRALGDMRMKSCGVIAAPELTLTALNDEASCLLLASDGVWEVLSSQASDARRARRRSGMTLARTV